MPPNGFGKVGMNVCNVYKFLLCQGCDGKGEFEHLLGKLSNLANILP